MFPSSVGSPSPLFSIHASRVHAGPRRAPAPHRGASSLGRSRALALRGDGTPSPAAILHLAFAVVSISLNPKYSIAASVATIFGLIRPAASLPLIRAVGCYRSRVRLLPACYARSHHHVTARPASITPTGRASHSVRHGAAALQG
eukprot:scaffold18613_cov112-Isochrysis_galbana.AAC.10